MRNTLSYKFTTVPADSGTVYPIDSTAIGVATPAAAPGPLRALMEGARVAFVVRNGDQQVTVYQDILTGNAGTSADWETESGGTTVVAASSTQPFEWRPTARDFRVRVVAGANNPDSLVVHVTITWGEDFGS